MIYVQPISNTKSLTSTKISSTVNYVTGLSFKSINIQIQLSNKFNKGICGSSHGLTQ